MPWPTDVSISSSITNRGAYELILCSCRSCLMQAMEVILGYLDVGPSDPDIRSITCATKPEFKYLWSHVNSFSSRSPDCLGLNCVPSFLTLVFQIKKNKKLSLVSFFITYWNSFLMCTHFSVKVFSRMMWFSIFNITVSSCNQLSMVLAFSFLF